MKRVIKKIAVLGSGIMGSRIACHYANAGVQVLLMDIVPKELTEAEKKKGLDLNSAQVRNRIVNEALQSAIKSNPAPLYHKDFAKRISTGNFEDDMSGIDQCDWVMEVVVENLAIKQKVFEQVEKYRKPGSLITSNTSGIPIQQMNEGRSEDFRKHFCGTHFFNPPRYLRLLEIIPGPDTDPEIISFLMHYGDRFLGKTTVECKDTPAFIANRVGIFAILKVVDSMQKIGLNIDEVDKLTGPVIGRPKSATFRTSDVVGLDTLVKVANNLYEGLPQDEQREMFKLPQAVTELENRKWLGDKTGQGFYKKIKGKDGKSEILTLDLKSMEYAPQKKAKFATLDTTKPIDNLRERFPVLLSGKDNAGEFYRDSFYALFQYVSCRIPEIADEIYKIDDALCAGFGWELGPFETWDILGVEKTMEKMEAANYKAAPWVYEMIEAGASSFFKIENGKKLCYNPATKTFDAIPGAGDFIILDQIRGGQQEIWKNAGASLFDIGDGILNLEFHTKMNTLGSEVIEGINKAISTTENEYRGLVIGNQGTNFSAGANLAMVFMFAIEQEYDELDLMIKTFQQTMMRARYSSIPVIVAPHGLSLGGGCELSLHADLIQAAAETYIGLVEVGVGLIPGGGGTKEMALRVAERYVEGDVELNALQAAFMNIATAKVATSAHEARDLNILRPQDGITLNKSRQIADAKSATIALAEAGYTQPVQKTNIKVQGRSGIAMFLAGIQGMKMGQYISEHDAKIAGKIAWVMNGGDLTAPTEVSEQYLLDLEREAFLSLCGEKKTLERIQSILTTGKPLRN
ncbi:MAG: 3-hydroxyacyl-CoA dehydrogenase/enoyl-CoA hydratase family protein [Cyclobacteriaceae bacterium]